jgi:hypothetical protein
MYVSGVIVVLRYLAFRPANVIVASGRCLHVSQVAGEADTFGVVWRSDAQLSCACKLTGLYWL